MTKANDQSLEAAPAALFISDLHLQAGMPATTEAFLAFLREQAAGVPQLYLLGDIFEYWPGDDDLETPYNHGIAEAIRAVAAGGTEVFWMGGNRDFLVGKAFAQAAGMTLLPDPFVATIAGKRIVLVHGDAQCTDDHAYMAFRTQVRNEAWLQGFLAQPLAVRKKVIEGLRAGSREAQRTKTMEIMDVNADAVNAVFDAAGTSIMIHGHTHRPACHRTAGPDGIRLRYVLPDWDLDAEPKRGGWISIDAAGEIRRHDQKGATLLS